MKKKGVFRVFSGTLAASLSMNLMTSLVQEVKADVINVNSNENYNYANSKSNRVAYFSFDGDNAGKIMINTECVNEELTIKYSLNGGVTWKKSTSYEIQLSDEEINSITA